MKSQFELVAETLSDASGYTTPGLLLAEAILRHVHSTWSKHTKTLSWQGEIQRLKPSTRPEHIALLAVAASDAFHGIVGMAPGSSRLKWEGVHGAKINEPELMAIIEPGCTSFAAWWDWLLQARKSIPEEQDMPEEWVQQAKAALLPALEFVEAHLRQRLFPFG